MILFNETHSLKRWASVFFLVTFLLLALSIEVSGFVSVQARDSSLLAVRRSDRASRDSQGALTKLPAQEHLRRASVYLVNRAFDEAREHWFAYLKHYQNEPGVPEALFGIGRSYFQSRKYSDALEYYSRVARTYPSSKEGREGLNFSGSALLRLGRPAEAVDRYIEYIQRYPNGERIESAHLNVIDSLREAGKPADAADWVKRATQRFAGTPTETNALFAALRLYVAESDWANAVRVADELLKHQSSKGVLTTWSEVAYLRAYSLEQSGNRGQALAAYRSIPDSANSYYGWLATERLRAIGGAGVKGVVDQRLATVNRSIAAAAPSYPAPHRAAILRAAKPRKIDPRFVLAIMRQESVFKPSAKSPAGARGLLQLTIDAAQKYAHAAGVNSLRETQLYEPETSIVIGSEYLAHLTSMFPRTLEPVAASYNGGEDNVARWVKRAKQQDPGVLTAEIGFDETKDYVQKVMSNYRAYRHLYTAELVRR